MIITSLVKTVLTFPVPQLIYICSGLVQERTHIQSLPYGRCKVFSRGSCADLSSSRARSAHWHLKQSQRYFQRSTATGGLISGPGLFESVGNKFPMTDGCERRGCCRRRRISFGRLDRSGYEFKTPIARGKLQGEVRSCAEGGQPAWPSCPALLAAFRPSFNPSSAPAGVTRRPKVLRVWRITPGDVVELLWLRYGRWALGLLPFLKYAFSLGRCRPARGRKSSPRVWRALRTSRCVLQRAPARGADSCDDSFVSGRCNLQGTHCRMGSGAAGTARLPGLGIAGIRAFLPLVFLANGFLVPWLSAPALFRRWCAVPPHRPPPTRIAASCALPGLFPKRRGEHHRILAALSSG